MDRDKIDRLIRLNAEYPDQVTDFSDSDRVAALKRITKFVCWYILGVIEMKHAMEGTEDRVD